MIIIPYIVPVAVALVFVLVCRFLVYGFMSGTAKPNTVRHKVRAPGKRLHKPVIDMDAVKQAVKESNEQDFSATTQIIPVGKNKKIEMTAEEDGKTKIISRDHLEKTLVADKKKPVKENFALEEEPEI